MLLFVDSDDPDQNARMRKLISAIAVHIMPEDTVFAGLDPDYVIDVTLTSKICDGYPWGKYTQTQKRTKL